jgi:hypothetical protein
LAIFSHTFRFTAFNIVAVLIQAACMFLYAVVAAAILLVAILALTFYGKLALVVVTGFLSSFNTRGKL